MEGQSGNYNKIVSTPVGVLIIALFGFSFGGMLVWQYWSLINQESENSRIETLEKVLIERSSHWKVYRNEQYKFEIRYPGGVEVKENDNSEPGSIRFELTLNENVKENPVEVFSLSILSPWWEGILRESFEISSEEEMMLAGQKVKKITGFDQTGFPIEEIWINYKKGILRIAGKEEIVEKMLPTLKFLE